MLEKRTVSVIILLMCLINFSYVNVQEIPRRVFPALALKGCLEAELGTPFLDLPPGFGIH